MLRTVLAVLLGTATLASAEVITITQRGTTFNPPSVVAAPGDTIKWQWTSLSHTITSGIDCTPDGGFNMPLNSANPVKTLVLPPDARGTISYYCSPHCFFGMTGEIVIVAPPPDADIDGDGCVSGPDLALLLGAWGTADPAADLDQSGLVDAADLAFLLGAWSC